MVNKTSIWYGVVTEKLLDTSRAKNLFEDSGISVAEWARLRGFSSGLVYQVLEVNRKCLRGQSHRIAIALGLKQGTAMDLDELSKRLESGPQRPDATSRGVSR